MACTRRGGPFAYGDCGRAADGSRKASVTYLVQSDDPKNDGWLAAINAAGLDAVGSYYSVGTDVDHYMYATLERSAKPHQHESGRDGWWQVTQGYTSRPSVKSCKDAQTDNPLLEPMKVSGSWSNEKREATEDRFGNPVVNTAFEQLKGPQVEFDDERGQVVVEQNVSDLQLDVLAALRNHVNDAPLWGLPYRSIKFSEYTWEKKYYGNCFPYYTRKMTFDVRIKEREVTLTEETDPYTGTDNSVPTVITVWHVGTEMVGGWDRDVLNEGTKCIKGKWGAKGSVQAGKYVVEDGIDYTNPKNFVRFKDQNGENARTLLDYRGFPIDTDLDSGSATASSQDAVHYIHLEVYHDGNLLALGIPTEL